MRPSFGLETIVLRNLERDLECLNHRHEHLGLRFCHLTEVLSRAGVRKTYHLRTPAAKLDSLGNQGSGQGVRETDHLRHHQERSQDLKTSLIQEKPMYVF